ncbi:MAG TPA: hypothetical protein PLQ45_07155, partial [Anaerohalosphaeraceae bacterium]|nr:hypothetical protein [Anaerohalosphaeraceae bacterium]
MKRAMNFQIAGIILLMIAEIHYGAYDDSLVSVLSAGHGLAAVNGAAVAGYNSTYADPGHPFTCGGLLSRVRIRMYNGGMDTTRFKIKVIRGSGPYALVGEIDATEHMAAAQTVTPDTTRFNYDTSAIYDGLSLDVEGAGIIVAAGDFLGFTVGSTAAEISFVFLADSGNILIRSTGDTITLDGAYANMALNMEATVKTKEYAVYNKSGSFGDGKTIEIPAFIDQNYYIIVKHKVSDGDNLQIA